MAAAEYYSGMPMTGHQSQPSHQSTQQYQGYPSGVAQGQYPQQTNPSQAPPPYQSIQQGPRPTVHFADDQNSSKPHRNSFSSQAPIPVALDHHYGPQQAQRPSPPLKPSQPPSYGSSPSATHLHPDSAHQVYRPAQSRPYLAEHQSQQSLAGYTSDPEPHRRRRRRHSHENRHERNNDHSSREVPDSRPSKPRSRSTNADGFLGAAGGGLIGDLIFPGLGTVGGAVAGWIGGKDYGKHRQHKQERRDREQENWERRFRRGSHEDDRDRRHGGSRERRSYERHKHEY